MKELLIDFDEIRFIIHNCGGYKVLALRFKGGNVRALHLAFLIISFPSTSWFFVSVIYNFTMRFLIPPQKGEDSEDSFSKIGKEKKSRFLILINFIMLL